MSTKWTGLLVALWLGAGTAGSVAGSPANSSSIREYWTRTLGGPLVPTVEYYIETDKAVYELGELVKVLHRISNLDSEARTWQISSSAGIELLVFSEDELLWRSAQLIFPAFWDFTLEPGEVYECEYTWAMTDQGGRFISPGVYQVYGRMRGGTGVSVPITIVPEPASSLLLCACASLLLKRRRG